MPPALHVHACSASVRARVGDAAARSRSSTPSAAARDNVEEAREAGEQRPQTFGGQGMVQQIWLPSRAAEVEPRSMPGALVGRAQTSATGSAPSTARAERAAAPSRLVRALGTDRGGWRAGRPRPDIGLRNFTRRRFMRKDMEVRIHFRFIDCIFDLANLGTSSGPMGVC